MCEDDLKKCNDLNEIEQSVDSECGHFDIVDENNFLSCLDCGMTTRKINHDFCFTDQHRVSVRTIYERSIFKDVQHLNFPWDVVSSANEIYNTVTVGKILRGNSRKGIIFACIYYAYKISGNYQIPEELAKIFGLEKKKCLKGLGYVNQRMEPCCENNQLLEAGKYIDLMINKIGGLQFQKGEILLLYDSLKKISSSLNRIRPQSLIASIIYYLMITAVEPPKITLAVFASVIGCSDTTIKKNLALITGLLD